MKNYYEILEVDKNASQEVIEKAYKTLAKKYHPDLQQGELKEQYSEKMKTINQAYEILSDNFKREEYNAQLQDEQDRIVKEKYEVKQQQSQPIDEETFFTKADLERERILNEQINQARQQAYYDAYIQDLKARGYKIRYKKSFKDYIKSAISLVITILVCFLIYQIPPVKNFFKEFYNENEIFKAIIDVIKNMFLTIFAGIAIL